MQRPLTRMAKGRMAESVREADGFDEIGIDEKIMREVRIFLCAEKLADRPADLSDFDRMRKPRAIEIVFARQKNLRLRLQSPECSRVNNPVAIDLKWRTVIRSVVRNGVQSLAVEVVVKFVLHAAADLYSTPNRRQSFFDVRLEKT